MAMDVADALRHYTTLTITPYDSVDGPRDYDAIDAHCYDGKPLPKRKDDDDGNSASTTFRFKPRVPVYVNTHDGEGSPIRYEYDLSLRYDEKGPNLLTETSTPFHWGVSDLCILEENDRDGGSSYYLHWADVTMTDGGSMLARLVDEAYRRDMQELGVYD